ncbi:MAG: hypothetical protein ABIC04_06435 [Nanoarchaeota archaeon]
MAEDSKDLFKEFDKFKKNGQEKTKKMDDKQFEIHLKINKLMIERSIYWIVILVLTALVLFNPISSLIKCGTTEDSTGPAVITDVEEPADIENTPEEETTVEEEPVETPEETPETEELDPSLSGKVKLAIKSVDVEKDDDGLPLKLEEISFSVDNQKKNFRPKVIIFCYASSDPDEIKVIERADITFPTLSAGTSKDYKITKFISRYLNADKGEEQKVYLKVYDGNTLVAETSKIIE